MIIAFVCLLRVVAMVCKIPIEISWKEFIRDDSFHGR
jgi:hypothetical protein